MRSRQHLILQQPLSVPLQCSPDLAAAPSFTAARLALSVETWPVSDEISFPFIEPSVFISQMRLHGGVCACAALVRDGQVSPWALNAFHADMTMSRGGGTLLVMATLCLTLGREELVKALLEANADASGGEYTPSSGKPTPLMGACQYGHIEVVKLLLEHGAATTIHVEDATSGLLPAVCISSIEHHPRLLSRLTHMHIRVSPPFGSDCDS